MIQIRIRTVTVGLDGGVTVYIVVFRPQEKTQANSTCVVTPKFHVETKERFMFCYVRVFTFQIPHLVVFRVFKLKKKAFIQVWGSVVQLYRLTEFQTLREDLISLLSGATFAHEYGLIDNTT